MERIVIKGGRKLRGSIKIGGSKNAALAVMAAASLPRGKSVLRGVPRLKDVDTMGRSIGMLGPVVRRRGDGLTIDARRYHKHLAPYDLIRTMRASIYVLGATVARLGEAQVSVPGGCAIGERPIDLHLKGLRALGVKVSIKHGYIKAEAERLRGGRVNLRGPHGSSVGATVNTLLVAVLARGKTVIDGAAREPEVVDCVNFLRAAGAKIKGGGTSRISIEGVPELNGVDYSLITDRIEAGTYLIAAAMTGGEVRLLDCPLAHMEKVLEVLKEAGCRLRLKGDSVSIKRHGELRPFRISVGPYPAFPTDLQAQFTALAAVTPGCSIIRETIFEGRFMHVAELRRMGAKIEIEGGKVTIEGVKVLSGAVVMASDLRASAALILAGLVGRGWTAVRRVYHLDRGYENMVGKLRSLGASIKRQKEKE